MLVVCRDMSLWMGTKCSCGCGALRSQAPHVLVLSICVIEGSGLYIVALLLLEIFNTNGMDWYLRTEAVRL